MEAWLARSEAIMEMAQIAMAKGKNYEVPVHRHANRPIQSRVAVHSLVVGGCLIVDELEPTCASMFGSHPWSRK